MDVKEKKPGKRPLYVYYIIAIVVIFLLNILVVPMISERSVRKDRLQYVSDKCGRGECHQG